jgi:hypothetical protein
MKTFSMTLFFALMIALALVFLPIAPSNGQRNQSISFDEQAVAQAKRFFGRMDTKCGDYYYYSYTLSWGEAFLFQCKYAPSVTAKGTTIPPRSLSEADRLNGVDPWPIAWDGLAIINLGLCRHQVYSQKIGPGYSAWGQWSDKNDEFLPLTNKKGKWEFHNSMQGSGHGDKVIVPVNCDDVPSENKRAPVKSPYWEEDVLKIPATYNGWFSLGNGPMHIRIAGSTYSQVYIDGTNNPRGPTGSGAAPTDALAPGLRLGSIIIKIGKTGKPFEAFGGGTINLLDGIQIDSPDEVFIGINDSYFGDNKGEHAVLVKGRRKFTGEDSANSRTSSAQLPRRIITGPGFSIAGDYYSIRLFNCDDRCRALVDDKVILETEFGQDSGWLTDPNAQSGKLRFQVINNQGAITYGFQVRKGENIVFEKICGKSSVVGCENDRGFPAGVAREFTYDLKDRE